MKHITLLILGAIGLAGCSSVEYSCNQYPDSGCQPVSVVYEKTNDGYVDYRKTLFNEKQEKKKTTHRHANNKRRVVHKHSDDEDGLSINIGNTHRALNQASPGDPILTKPVVMRILFDGWVDKENDLHTGGYVYVKLRDSEWQLNN